MMLSQIVKKQAEMVAARKAAEVEAARKPAGRPSARAAARPVAAVAAVAAAKPKPAPQAARPVAAVAAAKPKPAPQAARPVAAEVEVQGVIIGVRISVEMDGRMQRLIAAGKATSKKAIGRAAIDKFLNRYVLRPGRRSVVALPPPPVRDDQAGPTLAVKLDARVHAEMLKWCKLSGLHKRQVMLAALRDYLFPEV